jgi:pimeloyl-ACP methyl ester carboxylesterase
VKTSTTEKGITVPTSFIDTVKGMRYAYRRYGWASGTPLLFLQHFTGTLDNWDPALTDPLALGRQVILFDNAGIGRSSGTPSTSIAEMAVHAVQFVDALGLERVDVLGFSLGGMVAQQMAVDRPDLVRRLVLAGTAPAGGENMSMLKPDLLEIFQDETATLEERMLRLFFSPSDTSQQAGREYLERIHRRTLDRDPISGMDVFQAQAVAIDQWGEVKGERYEQLARIRQPVLVFNGNNDIMIPTMNSYALSEHLPNAQLLIYPDSGHGALFQYAQRFSKRVADFLDQGLDNHRVAGGH